MNNVLSIDSEENMERNELPQIDQKDLPSFKKYLDLQHIPNTLTKVDINKLEPIQNEINKKKIQNLSNRIPEIIEKPIVVDKDYKVLDGHHRWLALKAANERSVTIFKIDLPLDQALDIMNSFGKSYNKDIQEHINLVRLMLDN